MKKKLLGSILLFVLLSLAAGCVRYDSEITIDKEGKADISLLYAISDEYSAMGAESYVDLEDSLLADSNITAEAYSQDGYTGYKYKLSDIDLISSDDEALNSILPDCSLIEDQDHNWSFYCDEGYSDYGTYISYYKDTIEQMDGYAKITITFPGKVTESNATSVSNGGKTCTWDLLELTDTELYATYKVGSFDSVIPILAVIILIVIIAIIVLIVFIVLGKKNHGNPDNMGDVRPANPGNMTNTIPTGISENNSDSNDTCYCTNCGNKLSKTDMFCGKCGQKRED